MTDRIGRLTAIVLALFGAGPAFAQYDLNGPNAAMQLQSTDPAADPDHDVRVLVPGLFHLHIDSGLNVQRGILLLASDLQPTPAGVPTPWGGAINIGAFSPTTTLTGVNIVFDGIGFSTGTIFDFFARTNASGNFDFQVLAGTYLSGADLALQAILSDPTLPPFNFDNTTCGDAEFLLGQTMVVAAGDDLQSAISFAGSNVFRFHGQTYTGLNVVSNGYVTFGSPSTLAALGATHDNAGFVNGEAAIAAALADWNPIGNGGSGVWYEEIGNQVRIEYGGPLTHPAGMPHSGGADANHFEIRLQLDDGQNPQQGRFSIRLTSLDANTAVQAGQGLFGHTPGQLALQGGFIDVNLRTAPRNSGMSHAQIEEHNPAMSAASALGFDGQGTPRGYNDFTVNGNGAVIEFTPNPPVAQTGDAGYASLPTGLSPVDAMQSATLAGSTAPFSIAGGQAGIIHGSFLGLAPLTGMFTVTLTEVATSLVFPCAAGGVLDSAGISGIAAVPNTEPSVRDGQGVTFATTPLGAAGSYVLDLIGENGLSRGMITINVVDPCAITQIFTLNDDDSTPPLPLVNPIQWYGTAQNAIFLNSNGSASFNSGSTDFMESEAKFFAGFAAVGVQPPRSGVALWYSDMNANGMMSGATYELIENTCANKVTCVFRNQNHFESLMPAGTFACTFDLGLPGSVALDYSLFVPGTSAGDNGIVGVTDGNPALGTNTSFTGVGYAAFLGIYTSAATSDSICEFIASGVAPPIALNFLDSSAGGGQFFIF